MKNNIIKTVKSITYNVPKELKVKMPEMLKGIIPEILKEDANSEVETEKVLERMHSKMTEFFNNQDISEKDKEMVFECHEKDAQRIQDIHLEGKKRREAVVCLLVGAFIFVTTGKVIVAKK